MVVGPIQRINGRFSPRVFPAALPLALVPLLFAGCADPVRGTGSWEAFGRTVEAEVWTSGEREGREALLGLEEQIGQVEAEMAYGIEGNRLARLNAAAVDGFHTVADRDFYRVLTLALDGRTNGIGH